MTNDLLYNIILKMQGQNQVLASVNSVQKKTTDMVSDIKKQIASIRLTSIIEQVDRVATAVNGLNGPGMKLNSSMKDLEAMTGLTGTKLKEVEGYARTAAKTFGGSAAQGVESYKMILGQLSPEIAKVPTALKSMGETVNYTSKLMGGDTTAATEVLTTAMNQYGISLEDPTQASKVMASMMNVMAAAAGEGSAELPQIKQALEQSGMAAKMANVSFQETNAAIQILDKAGKKGSEGGVALRNVLVKLGQGKYIPKDYQEGLKKAGVDVIKLSDKNLTLADRLKLLKPAMKDSALLSAWLGEGADGATKALMEQIPTLEKMTKAVDGTKVGYEQAAIVMESQEEKNKRLQASVDDFKISLFNATNGMMGYATVVSESAQMIAGLAPLFSGVISAVKFLTNAQKMQALWTKICTAAQWLWNAAMTANPVGLIIVGIAALVAIIAVCWNKFEGFRTVIFKGWEALKLFGTVIKNYVINRIKEMVSGITGIGATLMAFFRGDWKKAWELGTKATQDLMGTKSGAKAYNELTTGWNGAMSAGQLASNAYTKKKNSGESVDVNSGILDPVKIPGAGKVAGPVGGGADDAKKKGKKKSDSIATGGTKHNYIKIDIRELIGIKGYNGSKSSAADKAGTEVLDVLLRTTESMITAGE